MAIWIVKLGALETTPVRTAGAVEHMGEGLFSAYRVQANLPRAL